MRSKKKKVIKKKMRLKKKGGSKKEFLNLYLTIKGEIRYFDPNCSL